MPVFNAMTVLLTDLELPISRTPCMLNDPKKMHRLENFINIIKAGTLQISQKQYSSSTEL